MAPRKAPVAIRKQFNDLDRWKAYQHYISIGQVKKTTARECYMSLGTLKNWIDKWDFDPETNLARNPPSKPSDEELARLGEVGDDVAEWKSLVKMAQARLREVIPKTNSADQLGRIIKDLSDRIDRSEGLHDVAPSTVQVNIRLEQAREMGEEMISQVRDMLGTAAQRAEIIDVEPLEITAGDEGLGEGGTDT